MYGLYVFTRYSRLKSLHDFVWFLNFAPSRRTKWRKSGWRHMVPRPTCIKRGFHTGTLGCIRFLWIWDTRMAQYKMSNTNSHVIDREEMHPGILCQNQPHWRENGRKFRDGEEMERVVLPFGNSIDSCYCRYLLFIYHKYAFKVVESGFEI